MSVYLVILLELLLIEPFLNFSAPVDSLAGVDSLLSEIGDFSRISFVKLKETGFFLKESCVYLRFKRGLFFINKYYS